MVGSSYRVMAATAIQLVWAVAYMMLAGIAYLIRDRITLHITLSAPLVVLPIIFFWLVLAS
jgi:OCT family organic cation transporter-like MFS transporter 4/5